MLWLLGQSGFLTAKLPPRYSKTLFRGPDFLGVPSGKTQFSLSASERWEKHVKLGSSAVGFAPSCVMTSSSLCGGIHPALFQLGNIPCCCEEDDGCVKVSTVSLQTAGRLQIFSQAITKSAVPGTRLREKATFFTR